MNTNHKIRSMKNELFKELDWTSTLVPFICIALLCVLFVLFPEGSSAFLNSIRFFLGDRFGSFYLLMGLGRSDLFPLRRIFPFWLYPPGRP